MPAQKDDSPKPVVQSEVCSVCGLEWKRHGQRPTIKKCVELLKADLAQARAVSKTWIQTTPGFGSSGGSYFTSA